MRRPLHVLAAVLAVALTVAGLTACGGGGSSSAQTDTSASVEKQATAEKAVNRSGSIAEFRVPGGPKQEVNRIIAGSREASAEELEAASQALNDSFDARAKHDWSSQCETLSKKFVEVVEENGSPYLGVETNCAKSVERAAGNAPPQALANNIVGSLAALRLVGGGQAFAFYHGTGGKDYLIPMEEENGEWKVDSLKAEEVPNS